MSETLKPPKPKVVACPQCGANVVWEPSNPFRPFCSERCKMIDLGAWATESYKIPVEEENDTLDSDRPAGDDPRN
jgi:endogenous inhibitor of DNA gyrase (YacG/DUF329 family)